MFDSLILDACECQMKCAGVVYTTVKDGDNDAIARHQRRCASIMILYILVITTSGVCCP